ncbi:MAG: hypothetical protein GHCLOJNM_03980 [bacterium]|nr:hypothetical protein [bacterium]
MTDRAGFVDMFPVTPLLSPFDPDFPTIGLGWEGSDFRFREMDAMRLLIRMRLVLAVGGILCLEGFSPSDAALPPKAGMSAPPIVVEGSPRGFDPTWVNHRGQVMLLLYVGRNTEVPFETVQRVNEWQQRLGPRGLQVVVVTEDANAPVGLVPEILVARDSKGQTRSRYQIVEDREYFLVDRYGRLRRQRINEEVVQKALSEYFDPTWVGYSGAWNQTYFVFRGDTLFYLADSVPDTIRPGESFDVRLVALPTFSTARPGARFHSPIQLEVKTEGGFEESVYRAELNEEVSVSTEMLLAVQARSDIEPGLHVLWVKVRHRHCGFGNCAGYQQSIPVPIWVE